VPEKSNENKPSENEDKNEQKEANEDPLEAFKKQFNMNKRKNFENIEELKKSIEQEFQKTMEEMDRLQKEKEERDSKNPSNNTSFWKESQKKKEEQPKKSKPIDFKVFGDNKDENNSSSTSENTNKGQESLLNQQFKKIKDILGKIPWDKFPRKYLYLAGGAIMAIVVYLAMKEEDSTTTEITEEVFFREYLSQGRIKSIVKKAKVVGKNFAYYVVCQTKDGEKIRFNINSQTDFTDRVYEDFKNNSSHIVKIEYEKPSTDFMARISNINHMLGLAFTILVVLSLILSNRRQAGKGGQMGLGGDIDLSNLSKSLAKMYTAESIKTTFKDVAGLAQAKVELQEFVEFLKNPEKYKKLGARIPRGAIMSGPPGTGKTLMAKAVAGESGVPFFAASGSDFVEVFVGVGAARVRDLFASAKKEKRAIIFIDEIDAIGNKRDGREGNDEREQTLNQILVEMDGFNTSENIIVFAATNRYDMLDSALVRPGRFDRNVELTLPDLDARKEIFMVHLQKLKLNSISSTEDYARRLASLTPGFSGSDIATICNEAAIFAVRNKKDTIDSTHFEEAVERLIGGVRTSKMLSGEEEKTVAYHESGHGVVSWFLKGAMPLLKVEMGVTDS